MPISDKITLSARGGNIWDIGSVHKIEHGKILEKLKREALTNPNQSVINVKNTIRQEYQVNRTSNASHQIYEAARNGKFKDLSPSLKLVRTWMVLTIIAVITELIVILYMSYSEGDISLPLIMTAVLLALGGIIAGYGLGGLLFNHYIEDQHKKKTTWIALNEKSNSAIIGLTLFFGLLFLIGCSYIRYKMSGEVVAGGLSLLLGLCVMISEAIHCYFSIQYDKFTDKQFLGLTFMAVQEHNRFNPDENDPTYDPKRDSCKEYFESNKP